MLSSDNLCVNHTSIYVNQFIRNNHQIIISIESMRSGMDARDFMRAREKKPPPRSSQIPSGNFACYFRDSSGSLFVLRLVFLLFFVRPSASPRNFSTARFIFHPPCFFAAPSTNQRKMNSAASEGGKGTGSR